MFVALVCSLCCSIALAVLAAYLYRQLKNQVAGKEPKQDNLKRKSSNPECYTDNYYDSIKKEENDAKENYYDSIKDENDAEKYEN